MITEELKDLDAGAGVDFEAILAAAAADQALHRTTLMSSCPSSAT
ncbi:hypothetical protein [Mycobacterium simiae]|nr:hypothetical protein [Mycobacterium simiae]